MYGTAAQNMFAISNYWRGYYFIS